METAAALLQIVPPVPRREHPSSTIHKKERLWTELIEDTAQWNDLRHWKARPGKPDNEHGLTRDFVWVNGSNSQKSLKPLGHHVRKVQGPPGKQETLLDQDGLEKINVDSGDLWCDSLCLDEVMASLEGLESPSSLSDIICILHRCRKEQHASSILRMYIHLHEWGLESHSSIGNHIIPVMIEVGCMPSAQKLFEKLEQRNEYSWTCLISGYINNGDSEYALALFQKLKEDEFVQPNGYTFVAALKACANLQDIERGIKIHAEVEKTSLLQKDLFLGNTLVNMYAKCGLLTKAQEVFDLLPVKDLVSWNALALGYVQHGGSGEALKCLERMQSQGLYPNEISYMCTVKACGNMQLASRGQEIHAEMIKKGMLYRDPLLGNALVDMYAKCALLLEAQEMFDKLSVRDVASWTALMTGYADHGHGKEALSCFEQMQSQGICPTPVTFVSALKACTKIGALEKGQAIHIQVNKEELLEEHVLIGSTLVAMYSKFGLFRKALEVLNRLSVQDAFAWTAVISGYVEYGHNEKAVDCFHKMQLHDICPDVVTYACIIKAYGVLGATGKGQEIHSSMVKKGFMEIDHLLGNALVDFYSKCGAFLEAQKVFENLLIQDVVSWTALIAGYAQSGETELVFITFDRMIEEGVSPNLVTFFTVINACCHGGLVDKGDKYFRIMKEDYKISPSLEIYTCMIDLFSRAGQFNKTVNIIEEMPHQADLAVWHTILGACQKWGNITFGRWAFENAMQMDDKAAVSYLCMCNIYINAGLFEDAKNIMAMQGCKSLGMNELQWRSMFDGS